MTLNYKLLNYKLAKLFLYLPKPFSFGKVYVQAYGLVREL